jgi:spermidine synthase
MAGPGENLSPFDHIRVVDEDGYRRLWFARKQQTSMSLDDPYETDLDCHNCFHLAFPLMPDATRFLVIGLGGGSLAKRVWRDYDGAEVDAIEIDPDVAEVARTLFELPDDERLSVFVEDGRAFLERSDASYDVIFVDAFADDHVPRALLSVEFLEICREHLTDGGVVAYNVFGALAGMHSQAFRRMYRTIGEAFDSVWLFSVGSPRAPEDVGNILMLATDAVISEDEFTGRIRDRLGGLVTVPGFESFADGLYTEAIDTEDTTPITDTPSWAAPPRPPAQ